MHRITNTSSLLVSRFLFILLPSVSLSFYISGSNPIMALDNQVRKRQLYTVNRHRGMYLEIRPDGTVSGSSTQTANSVLELRSVNPGQTVIRGLSSSLYLCLDGRGHLNGQIQYNEGDCTFLELLLADGYTRFLSVRHGLPVSLASKRSPMRQFLPFTQFLPLMSGLVGDKSSDPPSQSQGRFDMDTDDPLGMRLHSIMSPLFSMDK